MKSFDVLDIDQRSDAWLAARCGRLTGSVAHEAFAKTKSGWAASRRNLIMRLVLERITGKPQGSDFVSPAMQAGIDREPLAIAAYEAATGEMVQRCGFISHRVLLAGCSPDGYLGDFETVLSIKCRQAFAHFEFVKDGSIPASAMTQMQHECWMTGARRAVYCSYNPDFPERLQLVDTVVTFDDDQMADYNSAALTFLGEVDREYDAMLTLCDPAGRLAAAVLEAK